MANKNKSKNDKSSTEPDSVYIFKLLLFFILGSIWLSFESTGGNPNKSLPVGLIFGLLFASHDHFQIDRKIEYAVLLAAAALSYVAPLGLVFLI